MFGILNSWRTVNSVLFYLTLVIAAGGLLGNGLVLWNLGFHIKKGPFNTYLLHLAAADFLFLSCQVAFSIVQAVLGSSRDTLYFVVTFLWFSAGLWLLAVLSAERCLSDVFPSCHQHCRPPHASTGLCVLVWVLTLPAVLLPANACGLLHEGTRLLACIRYHAVSVTWLLSLACVALGACLLLFIWVHCCSPRPRPTFCGIVQGSGVLLLFCRLPFILYWSLWPILNFLLPIFLPLATLLACVDSSAKPLLYFVMGRQPGNREPLRTVLQKALGEGSQPGARGLSLPMGPI
uniref:MAS related GPR family member G n=1 Tax=Sciurus vulgaris TaxID=55149 RepID=A0A8D2DJT7_SCIVU